MDIRLRNTETKFLRKIFCLFAVLNVMSLSPQTVLGGWQGPDLTYEQDLRLDLRHDEDLYIHRINLQFSWRKKGGPAFKLSPFFEVRRNLGRQKWQRREAGIELGVDLFNWLYLGEGFHYAWLSPQGDVPEAEMHLLLTYPLFSKMISKKLAGYIFEEHTYDLENGEGTRNEAGLGLRFYIFDHMEGAFGWRHVDRIHQYDSDQAEFSLSITF